VTVTHLRPGIRPQIKDRLDAERSQLLVVTAFGLRATVEVIVAFPEVLDLNCNVIARRPPGTASAVSRRAQARMAARARLNTNLQVSPKGFLR